MKRVIFCFLAAAIFFGCNNNLIFSDFYNIPSTGWNKDSVFSFDVEIFDTLATYEIAVLVRNTDDFPRQNLWLGIELAKDGKVLSIDTTEFFLSSDYGKWVGSGIGSYFDNEFQYKQNVTFYKSGKYTYNIRHFMRFEDLKGLKYIGLKVFKEKNIVK